VQAQLIDRVTRGIQSGALPAPAASFMRLFHAEADWQRDDLAIEIAGAVGTTGSGATPGLGGVVGVNYLMRQGSSLGGGSTEMSRNIISERILGMPREFAADRDVPFSQVKRAKR
jgi:alkylation response protein AidB-like acyl-CoA dehydrogenase